MYLWYTIEKNTMSIRFYYKDCKGFTYYQTLYIIINLIMIATKKWKLNIIHSTNSISYEFKPNLCMVYRLVQWEKVDCIKVDKTTYAILEWLGHQHPKDFNKYYNKTKANRTTHYYTVVDLKIK